jgi:hypothetical protein
MSEAKEVSRFETPAREDCWKDYRVWAGCEQLAPDPKLNLWFCLARRK